jgi:hypothetical protein
VAEAGRRAGGESGGSVAVAHFVKRDAIHRAVVGAFIDMGLSVYDAAHAGNSFPDLVVGWGGQSHLVELKTGKAPLTAGQVAFAASWRGSPVVVLRSVTEAVDWACDIRRRRGAQCPVTSPKTDS